MATVVEKETAPVVLRGVPYKTYVLLRNARGNRGLRMTYHDGTLEIMSPEFRHEIPTRRFDALIRAVGTVLGIPLICSGSTTFKRAGRAVRKGHGKEPDSSFYFTSLDRIASLDQINLDTDPPPELWIEVDNRVSSQGRLPLYAALGIPEVWRYDVRQHTLWFGRLEGEHYIPIDRSVALPMLTPELVLFALGRCGADESAWNAWLLRWAAEGMPNDVA